MATEIERKFLANGGSWKQGATGERVRQAYLSTDKQRVIDEHAWLTVKGQTQGISRLEFEYGIPVDDADEMLRLLCHQPIIDKTRYRVRHGDHTWEIDEFHGANDGLVIAEIELQSEYEPFEHPEWLGEEVSGDRRYFNSSLVRHPFSDW